MSNVSRSKNTKQMFAIRQHLQQSDREEAELIESHLQQTGLSQAMNTLRFLC